MKTILQNNWFELLMIISCVMIFLKIVGAISIFWWIVLIPVMVAVVLFVGCLVSIFYLAKSLEE